MENEMAKTGGNIRQNSRVWTGIFLVVVGGILLASKMGAPVPGWLLSWEVFVIGLGLLIGVRHKFRNPAWLILVFVGSASFIDNFYPDLNIRNYIWPAAIMLLGLFFILRPKKTAKGQMSWPGKTDAQTEQWQSGFQPVTTDSNVTASSEDVVDVTAVFGGIKKRLMSKTFRGGDITAFMGGAEIDLTGADIQNTAVLDVSAVFGGIKLIIPADWRVQNKATAVFGGVEDKRYLPASFSNKVLIIDGAAVFGGIELKSY